MRSHFIQVTGNAFVVIVRISCRTISMPGDLVCSSEGSVRCCNLLAVLGGAIDN